MKNKKNSFLVEISILIRQRYPAVHATIMTSARKRYDALCMENAREAKAVQTHTRSRIYPGSPSLKHWWLPEFTEKRR